MKGPVPDPVPAQLTDRTAVLLRAALTRAETSGEQALAPLKLTGREYGVLAFVVHGGQVANQRRLGATLGLDRTTTMKLVTGLVHRGLLVREQDPTVRRVLRVKSCPEGRRL